MGDTDVDFFLETLKQLIMSSNIESIIKRKHQLKSLEEDIVYMRGFLKVTEKKRNKYSEVMDLVRQIKDVVFEAENIIEVFLAQALKANQNQDHLSLDLESVKKKLKTLTAKVKHISIKNMWDINAVAGKKLEPSFYKSEGNSSSSDKKKKRKKKKKKRKSLTRESNISKMAEEKMVVGLKDEVEILLGKLDTSGVGGQLEIISIVGAAGGGKTTLAREVYEHPLTKHAFQVHAWVNVSQDYDKTMKRNLLISILKSASPNKHGNYEKSCEDQLGEDTYNCLKGKKYLIVMDDIWSIDAWIDIQRSLPDGCNGSKVLFTSRVLVEPKGIHCIPHSLAPLSKSCSLELLQKKKYCPPELDGISEDIVESCTGLPLMIVAVAGILAMEDKTLDVWKKVSKHLSSIIVENQNGCMEILELSYNHLPIHLKACFVYIGGFPEDSEILVRDLIWLWIAEGFIQQNEGDKRLEDVAKDYLSSLINRNLVMVARKRSIEGIKACRIHDLLRELCLKKAEDNFLVPIYRNDTSSFSAATKHRRLFIGKQFFPKVPLSRKLRSFVLCPSLQDSTSLPIKKKRKGKHSTFLRFETNLSFFVENFELLRVLCFISKCRGKIGRGDLVHLRYLALRLPNGTSNFESPFSGLFNLETLNLQVFGHCDWKFIQLPPDIFKMVKLRHLYAKEGVFKYHQPKCFSPDVETGIGFDCSSKLDNLQTLCPFCPCEECQNFLVRTPNLRKLGFYGELISGDSVLMLLNLECLKCLETLKFEHCRYPDPDKATTLPPGLKFPLTIVRLTLKYTGLKWGELSILQTLPKLEVLKLSTWACRGHIWNISELEEGFSQLKYLRLQDLDIEEWNASEEKFPKLEVLVVICCPHLKQIPTEFGNLSELREIEVRSSSTSAEESARKIQEERRNARGDDDCINLLARENSD